MSSAITSATTILSVNVLALSTSMIGKIDSTQYSAVTANPDADAILSHRGARHDLPTSGIANSARYVKA